jgi:endonuclease YncB( thermonuclease family)
MVLLHSVWLGPGLISTATACDVPVIGQGRVARVSDWRTLVLDDGREVRLAGIETPAREQSRSALEAMMAGRMVVLHGPGTPDRYGRLIAMVFEPGAAESVQARMVAQGAALAAIDTGTRSGGKTGAEISVKVCAADLPAAEIAARIAKKGIWGSSTAIKNAEKAGDILAEIGQFAVVEGRPISVRRSGATVYLNFGRRWTRDFAVTISSRKMASFEAAGLDVKTLERRRLRIRGWVERRGGPRIVAVVPGQIEFVGGT